jgi:hypothetical protein
MVYVFVAIGVLVLAFAAFIWWRYTSVERGARQRDDKIARMLDPLGEKLAKKEPVSPDEVAALAAQPHVRPMLYALLKHFERLDLFPARYLDAKSQGEAQLAYWMMHPNELQDAPEEIELIESITRPLDGAGENGEFLVFRYKMAEGHWAAKHGWLLGLAGPYLKNDVPYSGIAGAFSRIGDKHGEVEPNELVDWYIGMATRKGA